ncbi:MAG: type II secretion system F family protein [Abditibacteriaceae bacterium]
MNNQTKLLFILIAVIVVCIVVLRMRRTTAEAAKKGTLDAANPIFQRTRVERFTLISRVFSGRKGMSWIDKDLVSAAIMLKPTEFIAINLVFLVVMVLVGLLHIHSMSSNPTLIGLLKRILWLILYIFLGWKVPQWILRYSATRRRTKLEYQLADALTIVASGLKGGYSFIQGLDMASKQLDDPIKMETARVLRLIQLGMDTPRALTQMAERVNSYDYYMTVSATNIQLTVGGNLASLLESIAETIRERIRLRRDIAVLTAQGRVSGAILVALPIGIFFMLFIINPGYMSELTTTDMGNNLLYGALVMQCCGIFWIKKLLDFDN